MSRAPDHASHGCFTSFFSRRQDAAGLHACRDSPRFHASLALHSVHAARQLARTHRGQRHKPTAALLPGHAASSDALTSPESNLSKNLQAACPSCVPGSKATRCPAGSSSWRQNSAEWLCSGLQHSLDFAQPPHHPKATLPCRRNRCRAAPRLRPNHGGFGMRALFIFRRKTSHMLLRLLAYKSHKARCAAAGPASVPA